MRTLLPLLVAFSACNPTEEEAVRAEGADGTYTPFTQEWIHSGARSVDIAIDLPEDDVTFTNLTGRFRLECPDLVGGCDHWDRYATFGIVLDAGEEEERYIELDRFITPYRTGFSWESDLTDYRPLLHGEQTFRVFIDTWVTEGHEQGTGWLFTANLDFDGGPPPSPEPTVVVPLWDHIRYVSGVPADVTAQFADNSVELPPVISYNLRSYITGHGFGGADNCAEFCALDHSYTIDENVLTREVWRADCDSTVTDSTQQGTWQYNRAGWCPGAQVFPWIQQAGTSGGETIDFSYDLENWTWAGDGGEPYYYMSAALIGYE
ncbi:MAG: hypothetical protein KC912_08135 [Proteobacteria bacterium]|nr:hypothetical protein [Pseudomonadota bacterium]